MPRISVQEAARQLGIQPVAVRAQMKMGILPIGDIVPGNGKRKTYYIYQELLDRHLRKGEPYDFERRT